jgi:hypothetical protein
VMVLSGSRGFLLDAERVREEKGDMTFLRPLRVVATVSVLAVFGVACGEDEEEGSGLSGSQSNSQGGSASESSGGSGGSSGPASTGVGTTEGPASTGEGTMGESATSTGSPTTGEPTTSGGTTTGDSTTGPGTTTGSPVGCGDNVVSGNEQCDGANLNGFTCEALGNAGGTLQCDPVTCTFDTQMCEVGGGESSGGTSG